MKTKPQGFVRAYLERVSGSMFEEPYRALIAELIRGHCGVYALYKGDRLYYVGLASNLMGRVKHHLKDRHKKRWDKFSVYLTSDNAHMKPLESLLLRIAHPAGNRVKGRLPGARDELRTLNRRMVDADATRRARLLGGLFVRNRVKRKTSAGDGSLGLAGLVDRRIPLRRTYKGEKLKATLRKDGHVSFGGTKYPSPTAAARAIVGRNVNGWKFWRYKHSREGWIELARMRR